MLFKYFEPGDIELRDRDGIDSLLFLDSDCFFTGRNMNCLATTNYAKILTFDIHIE